MGLLDSLRDTFTLAALIGANREINTLNKKVRDLEEDRDYSYVRSDSDEDDDFEDDEDEDDGYDNFDDDYNPEEEELAVSVFNLQYSTDKLRRLVMAWPIIALNQGLSNRQLSEHAIRIADQLAQADIVYTQAEQSYQHLQKRWTLERLPAEEQASIQANQEMLDVYIFFRKVLETGIASLKALQVVSTWLVQDSRFASLADKLRIITAQGLNWSGVDKLEAFGRPLSKSLPDTFDAISNAQAHSSEDQADILDAYSRQVSQLWLDKK